jgi:hypothetical protein
MIPRVALGPRSHTVPPFSSSRIGLSLGHHEGPRADLARDFLLAETILNRGGTTQVPEKVMEALGLKPKPGERSKLLWTPAGDDVIVTKGTPQSDWRKTMLRKNGTAAIPKHIQKALTLRITSHGEERLLWIRSGDQIVIRKGSAHELRSVD